MRRVASSIRRAPSTVIREIGRHGGRATYRAAEADRRAWDQACRPKACRLAVHRRLQKLVARKYTSFTFGRRCEQLGVRPSMGSVGDAYDNAMAESFFATLECELLDRERFKTPDEAQGAIFAWIEAWYNRTRRHSSIGYLSPNEFERRHAEEVPQPRVEQRSSILEQPGASLSRDAATAGGDSAPAPPGRLKESQAEQESSRLRETPESA